jgi:HPt (histidine-containing phosphotransfer) domain-containing protein
MIDKKKLTDAGIDYDGGVQRLMGNEEMYESFLKMFAKDESFAGLEKAMADKDYDQAFLQAHTLKGVAGNLSMKRLYDYMVPFVDMLRNGADIPMAVKSFPELKKIYEETVAALC